jgi:hypothetical protein
VVVTSTSGSRLDPDGYRIEVDGRSAADIAIAERRDLTDLTPGEHEVTLGGVAHNCSVAGENPRQVEVPSSGAVEVRFEVVCVSPSGSLAIAVATRGDSIDDGYTVSVDSGTERPIGIRDSIVVPGLSVGAHQVRLGGVAAPCAVAGANPRNATIPPDAVGRVDFVVACPQSTTATLVVSLSTTVINWPGFNARFAIVVNGGREQPIPANGSTVIGPLPAVPTSVLLKHPPFCAVGGFIGDHTNPRTVVLRSGGTTTVRFSVLCIG